MDRFVEVGAIEFEPDLFVSGEIKIERDRKSKRLGDFPVDLTHRAP